MLLTKESAVSLLIPGKQLAVTNKKPHKIVSLTENFHAILPIVLC
jgi:hypothetical protein